MSTFPAHTIDSAPEASRPFLEGWQKQLGFLPNLFGRFAESPALTEAYAKIAEAYETKTSLNPVERQVVLLTTSYENTCTYCMAAHSTIAGMVKMPNDALQALRSGAPIPDAKLEALRTFTRTLVEKRGWADDADIEAFLAAGYTQQSILDVVTGIGLKTLSNYTNHMTQPTVDAPFQPQTWAKPEPAATV